MRNTNKKSETVQEAYAARIEAITGKLDKIKAHILENRAIDSEVNWGHVGDMGRVNELLDELSSFIDIR